MVTTAAPSPQHPLEQQLAVLGDRTRLRLLHALERHELTVHELCAVLQLPQSTVSRHLRVLADHGWVVSRPEGASRYYRFRRSALPAAAGRLWRAVAGELGDGEDEARLRAVLAERQSRARTFFASAAAGWDRTRGELFGDRTLGLALAGLVDDGWTVGDLGCGTGQATAALAPWAGRVVAVDASPEMLDAARERLRGQDNVDLRQGELEALPVVDGELDAAVVLLVLHYLPAPERALAELARACRPGARVLLVEMLPHAREELREQMGHVWLGFEPARVAEMLAAAGFGRVRTHPLPVEVGARGPALFAASAVREPDTGGSPRASVPVPESVPAPPGVNPTRRTSSVARTRRTR